MKTTILGILIGAFVSIVCGMAAAQTEIKVGIAGPLSGSSLDMGETQEVGAQKAFEHLNDKGGLLGMKIVVISVDDACEPRQAKAVARQLVNEGVVFVVGHVCSACSLAAIREEDAFEPDGTTLYSYGAVQAWAQAVKQADSLKPKAVINVLRAGSFDTVLGKIGFDEKGDVTGMNTFVWYVFGKEDYSMVK